MAVVGEDIRNSLPPHRIHRNAVDQTVAFVKSSPIQFQTRQKRLPGLRMHGYIGSLKDSLHSLRGHLSQFRSAMGESVEYFGEHFIGRNQVNLPKYVASTAGLCPVLIAGMKNCAPVKSVDENAVHLRRGAPFM